MGFWNKYPYTDFHELNLNWILEKITELEGNINDFEVVNKITFAGEWDITRQYSLWSIVENGSDGYLAINNVPAGISISNTDYWLHVSSYMELITDMQAEIATINTRVNKAISDMQSSIDGLDDRLDNIIVNSTGFQILSQNSPAIQVIDGSISHEFTIPLHAKVVEACVDSPIGSWHTNNVVCEYTNNTDDITVSVTATGLTSSYAHVRLVYSINDTFSIPELEDIRIGTDGTPYDSAGDAVRNQIEILTNSVNLLNSPGNIDLSLNWVSGAININTGELTPNDQYLRTGPYDISIINSFRAFNNTPNVLEISMFLYQSGSYIGRIVGNATVPTNGYYNISQPANYSNGEVYFLLRYETLSTITPEDVTNFNITYKTGLTGVVGYRTNLTSNSLFSEIDMNGIYGVSNAVAASISDSPSDAGGNLLVIKSNDANTPTQIYCTNNNDDTIYYRTGTSGIWYGIAKTTTPYTQEKGHYFVNTIITKNAPSASEHMYIFGDSIATGTHGGFTWASLVAQHFNCIESNYAVGGSAFSHYNDGTQEIMNQLESVTNWSSCDIAFIAAGTNDAAYNTPGDILREKVQDVITYIQNANANIRIIFITPIQRNNPANNVKLPKIAGAICNVALANGCEVINGFDFPISCRSDDWLSDFTDNDGLHPNATGKRVYAASVITALK